MSEDVRDIEMAVTGEVEKSERSRGDSDGGGDDNVCEEVGDETMEDDDLEKKISDCENALKESPKDYDVRLELIRLLKRNGDLDELRQQRKIISTQFAMPPGFWMDWIEDEKRFGGEKEEIKRLFVQAVTDFHSPEVYLEYAQWACGVSIPFAEEVMEEAVSRVGLRCDCAYLIWNTYLDLEKMLLKSLKDEAAEKQNAKVIDIYSRMLRIPHSNMQSSWNDYCTFLGTKPNEALKADYEKALRLLPELEEFENQLNSDTITLEEKLSVLYVYIEFEKKGRCPSRIQMAYERAVLDSVSVPNSNLWLQYGAWADFELKIRQVAVDIYKRAVRHSPCAALWQQYFTALERAGDIAGIYSQWNESLETVTTVDEGFGLYRTHIYSLRRKAVKEAKENNSSVDYTEVLKAFDEGTVFLKKSFGDYWDSPKAQFRKMHALFLYTDARQPEKARKIWNDILASGNGCMASSWIEAANLERYFGSTANARKLLYKGINSASDHPHMAYDALIQFEREVGTLDELDIALMKVNSQVARIASRPRKRKEKNVERRGRKDETAVHQEQQEERSTANCVKKTKEEVSDDKGNRLGKNSGQVTEKKSFLTKRPKIVDEDGFAIPQKPVVSLTGSRSTLKESEIGENVPKEGPCTAIKTVFISNLDFKLPKERVFEVFPEAQDVRLVYRGMSKLHKGYGYVDFADSIDAIGALSKDRTLIDGRPLYVSEYKPHEPGEKSQFRYAIGLEKNKVFVSNVHYDATTEQLAEVFSGFGVVKDVRIVTHKSGKSKGCAYVEFEDESAANGATKADEIILLDRKLSVALSNPPKKQSPSAPKTMQLRVQPKSKVDLVPRAVAKAKDMLSAVNCHGDGKSEHDPNDCKKPSKAGRTDEGKLSNEQFRRFLQ